ncbi:MAG: GGDEF domain-containing protein [Lachnospiraceae bacterium]
METNGEECKRLKEHISKLEAQLRDTLDELKMSQRRYEIAVSFSDTTIFDYNIKTKKILTQPSDYQIFGMPGVLESGVEEVIQSGIIEERSRESIRKLYHEIDHGATEAKTIVYAKALDGTERTLELKMISIFDKDGQPTHAVGLRKDVTDIIRLHKEEEYSALLSSDLLFIYEANVTQDKILRRDDQWATDMSMQGVETLTGVLQLMCDHYVAKEDAALFMERQSRKSILQAYKKGRHIVTFEYRKKMVGKEYRWYEARINLIQDIITGDINMRVYILNIDDRKKQENKINKEREQYEKKLLYKAQHDQMTGYYNKNATTDKIEEILSSEENQDAVHILYMFDVDHFKMVNDVFGHEFGDKVLIETTAKIGDLFRSEDILGRVGGDEFIIFMKNVKSDRIALLKANEMCETAMKTYLYDGKEYTVTVSVGIAVYGRHGNTFAELYRHADEALYEVKEHERNSFAMYHDK